ncbi:GNAT family N-acetyltransferase [Methylobacterium sp. J-001]|uniref:GNAT family N-acetyltransferase n=1 Tax=Methylobacterium sp. J-001 TaxID=2836609 RepID=UPI001FBAD570|nr:GNAT family N-acetyltransferase [Methylobacterium sp. J-001]MCJ2120615.1 GNAT family N-acetyltransferase [Methylobacterium sp. J-001]
MMEQILARSEFSLLKREEISADGNRRDNLAELVRLAALDFYSIIPLPAHEIRCLIGDQLSSPGTETEHLYVARHEGEDVALFSCLPAAGLDRVRREVALTIIRRLQGAGKATFMTSLQRYSATIQPLVADGLYLSRLAVSPGNRGKGFGAIAVAALLDLDPSKDIFLHVRRDNTSAVKLYERFGFKKMDKTDYQFASMVLSRT